MFHKDSLSASPVRVSRSNRPTTSRHLIGQGAVASVIVSRQGGTDPNSPAKLLTATERDAASAEAAAGLGWLAADERDRARLEFVFDRIDIELAVGPSATSPDNFEGIGRRSRVGTTDTRRARQQRSLSDIRDHLCHAISSASLCLC